MSLAVGLLTSFQACQTPSRGEIEAKVWNNNFPLPQEICDKSPELQDYGFYRRLNDGRLEIQSVCNPLLPNMVSMKYDDFKALLDQYIKRPSENNLIVR